MSGFSAVAHCISERRVHVADPVENTPKDTAMQLMPALLRRRRRMRSIMTVAMAAVLMVGAAAASISGVDMACRTSRREHL